MLVAEFALLNIGSLIFTDIFKICRLAQVRLLSVTGVE